MVKTKTQKVLVILLILIALLLFLDIITGLYYWNRDNLRFSYENFENLLLPLISFLSLVVYTWALMLAFKQNKTIVSQHLFYFYEKEIDRLKLKLEKKEITTSLVDFEGENINGLNYPVQLGKNLYDLYSNDDYLEDLDSYEKGKKFSRGYFKKRSYHKVIMFLNDYTFDLFNRFNYNEIKVLVNELNETKLTHLDKSNLKKRIKRELLINYISFVESEDNSLVQTPIIPILYDTNHLDKDDIRFKKLSETSFRNHFDWFSKNL